MHHQYSILRTAFQYFLKGGFFHAHKSQIGSDLDRIKGVLADLSSEGWCAQVLHKLRKRP